MTNQANTTAMRPTTAVQPSARSTVRTIVLWASAYTTVVLAGAIALAVAV